MGIGFVGAGFILKGLDLWRWHRLATSMGLERMGGAAVEGSNPMETYRGEFEGQQVTLDDIGNQSAEASNWTRVTAFHDADPEARVVIRERGLGGTPAEEFPPSVDVADAELTDRFHVYTPDAALAREVLRGAVRETLVGAEAVDQVQVAGGASSRSSGASPSTGRCSGRTCGSPSPSPTRWNRRAGGE